MAKDGVVGEITLNTQKAADGRHPPVVTTVTLPASHPELPAGTVLIEGDEAGTAKLAAASGDQTLIGVLDEAVEADEGTGNALIHGSCSPEILATIAADGTATPAGAALIGALRGIGIYA